MDLVNLRLKLLSFPNAFEKFEAYRDLYSSGILILEI